MSKILIVYATTDGHTEKVAEFVATQIRDHGLTVEVRRAGDQPVRLEEFAGVVLAGSIHVGGLQRVLRHWVSRHAEALRRVPTALLTVCLGVLQKDPKVHADLLRIVDRFRQQTGWTPDRQLLVAGALRYTQYGFLKRWVMRRIAGRAGGSTDTSRDHEYTDWVRLRGFAQEFAEVCRPTPPAYGLSRGPTVAVSGRL